MSLDLSTLLSKASAGEPEAIDRLTSILYQELRRLARRELAKNRRSPTLHTTALVHEAYLKLAGRENLPFGSRGQFFAVAARAMRQVIVDHARTHRAQKRGAGVRPLPLDENRIAVETQAEEILAVNEALQGLSQRNSRLVQVVECRFFVGLTEEQTAHALDLSRRTVQRDWIKARSWLLSELERTDRPDRGP